jgi:hypothetical protein
LQFVFENRDQDVVAGRYESPKKENAHQSGESSGVIVLIHKLSCCAKNNIDSSIPTTCQNFLSQCGYFLDFSRNF